MTSWYLIHTKPRQEQTARRNLERQGYRVYLPLARAYRRREGRRVASIGALFPRYLFVELNLGADNVAPIRSTPGVSALVRFGQEPARVPAGFIASLRDREDADGVHEWAAREIPAGARVRIADGRLQGYEAIFLARSGRERVSVMLDILGRKVRASVDAGQIEPVR